MQEWNPQPPYMIIYCCTELEARRDQFMGDFGGNCGNVNVKGINRCCSASTKDTNDGPLSRELTL